MGTLDYNKMRYHQDLEDLLRISQEYDNNTKTIGDVLLNINWEGNRKSNSLTSLGNKLTQLVAVSKLRNETIKFIFNCIQPSKIDSKVCKEPIMIPDKTFLANLQEKILTQLREADIQLDFYSVSIQQFREEIKSIITNSGHCDPADLYPYLEKGNQDQIVILNSIWGWMHPNGRENHIVSGSSNNIVKNQNSTTEASTELPNMSPDSNVIETEATTEASTESPNTSPDSNVIENEAPKSDMITVDLKTQGTQLNPNPKPNPMPKKTRTPRYKFKRTKKGGKVQKIQSPGVHKMKSKHHRNKRIYWSKKLWYANNISHDSNPSTLHNFCPMVTSNINGLHTVIHSQNMWLLRRPRVKIK